MTRIQPQALTEPSAPRSPLSALHTDRYTLTMAQSFYLHGQAESEASYELFVRKLPEERAYLITAGLGDAVRYLSDWRFTSEEIEWLRSEGVWDEGFLNYLSEIRFTGDVDAIPEGTAISAGTPMLRVTASRAQATLIESALLVILNHQTMIASKAARIVCAAEGRPVWDFSLRRLHGAEAALGVARAAWIAGCAGTASMDAARRLDIPSAGTMAHHYVQAFGVDGEREAFKQFLGDYQETTLLTDTYDCPAGADLAISAALELGARPGAIRLDSGDLAALAEITREKLDRAGMRETRIFASNDLDEYKISELIRRGAPIDAFGVGTMLGTSADAPNLGGVYKLVESEPFSGGAPQPVIKLADGKQTDPGRHQVWRREGERDLLALISEPAPAGARPLLMGVIRGGRAIEASPLQSARDRCAAEIAALPGSVTRINHPEPLKLERSERLKELVELMREERAR